MGCIDCLLGALGQARHYLLFCVDSRCPTCLVPAAQETDPTVEDVFDKETIVDRHKVRFTFVDVSGMSEYRMVRDSHYANVDCFLLCFSIAMENTFTALTGFVNEINALRGSTVNQVCRRLWVVREWRVERGVGWGVGLVYHGGGYSMSQTSVFGSFGLRLALSLITHPPLSRFDDVAGVVHIGWNNGRPGDPTEGDPVTGVCGCPHAQGTPMRFVSNENEGWGRGVVGRIAFTRKRVLVPACGGDW